MSDTTNLNPFFPIILVAISGIIFFGSELSSKWTQREKLQATLDQRSKALLQAKQQKAPLEAIARDLVELAKTDANIRALLNKYDIRFVQSPSNP